MPASRDTFVFSRSAARVAGQSGGQRKNSGYLVYVEGQPWRLPDLALHLGIPATTARDRVKRLRAAGKPLTIQGLST